MGPLHFFDMHQWQRENGFHNFLGNQGTSGWDNKNYKVNALASSLGLFVCFVLVFFFWHGMVII
jgi:hypothetical protein